MYTLYQAVGRSLPRTAYLKYIDVWLLFHLIVPFIIFAILYYAEHVESEGLVQPLSQTTQRPQGSSSSILSKSKKKHLVHLIGKVVLPVTVTVFAIIYWIIAITHYYFSE